MWATPVFGGFHMTTLALLFIRFYQRFISPRKGFRCAHAAFFGGASCSGAIYNLILERGLWPALPHIRNRFLECDFAYKTLLRMGRITRGRTEDNSKPDKAGKSGKTCGIPDEAWNTLKCCGDVASCLSR
jgi:uncharacterized protein